MVGNLHVLDQTAHGDNPGTQLDEQNLVMFNSDIAIQKGIEKSCYISSGYDAVGAECSVGQQNVTLILSCPSPEFKTQRQPPQLHAPLLPISPKDR
jgi:hypothetical protein